MKKSTRKQFNFYCYNPPTSGLYYVNGFEYFAGEDFRSVERYKQYKAMGNDMLMLRYENSYNGEEWETCNAKMAWKKALSAGIKKIFITDRRIDDIINHGKILIGDQPECRFKSEKELDEKLIEWTSVYKDMPGFYGIQLVDEPVYEKFVRYGQVARSLRRILPGIYLQCNLFPMGTRIPGETDPIAEYRRYVGEFLDLTGIDCVCVDPYPFRREYIIYGFEITTHQIIAEECKKRGVEFHAVMQAFSSVTEFIYRWRAVNERDMYWQMNLALGFGVNEYSFYTYFPKPVTDYIKGKGELNGTGIMNLDGSPTNMYYYLKRIIKEFKKFAPVQLKYKYQNSYIITEKGKTYHDFEQSALALIYDGCPIDVKIDKGVAIVTELVNGDDKLFMIQNIDNIKEEYFNGAQPMKVEFTLPDGKKTFYYRGEKFDLTPANGVYSTQIKIGDAIFVELIKN